MRDRPTRRSSNVFPGQMDIACRVSAKSIAKASQIRFLLTEGSYFTTRQWDGLLPGHNLSLFINLGIFAGE